MDQATPRRPKKVEQESLKISVGYGIVSGLYIIVSNRLLYYWVKDPDRMSWIATAKGTIFVLVTSVFLYFLLRNLMKDLLRVQEQAWAAQKSEALGRMAAGVAHDFNNILQVVTVASQLGAETAGPRSELGELFSRSNAAASRGRDLVRQLMAFARQEASKPQKMQVLELFMMVEALLKGIVRLPTMLMLEVSADAGWVEVDPVHLEQVLMNLVVNGLDSMPRGGEITVRAQRREQWVELIVEDTGSGISPEVLPHIFEPFFTTKGGQGTGLGLATVQGIVRQWGGSVEVRSSPHEGTRFSILVPACAAPA
jgi:signal transduction histidine kinase